MSQVFLLLRLDTEAQPGGHQPEVDLSPAVLQNNILLALRNLFGEVGAGYPVDILKINRTKQEFLVATYAEYLVKIRTALTLHGRYQGDRCCFSTIKVTESLLSLD